MSNFGYTVRMYRQAGGATLDNMASRCGCSVPHLSKIETGKTTPSLGLVERIDEAYGANGELLQLAMASYPHLAPGAVYGLPPAPRNFVGREPELNRLVSALATAKPRNVVIGGMAGVGKTAFATMVGRRVMPYFPDGQPTVDFRSYTAATAEMTECEAISALLRTVAPAETVPIDRDSRLNLLRTRLAGKRMLLFFDNVRSAAQVSALLPSESGCAAIIMSRRRLTSLDDACHVDLRPLNGGEAAELFCLVAGDESVPSKDVVASCRGLPLAIRILAARYRSCHWSFDELRHRLASASSRFDMLDDGDRSVAGALSLSCDRLDPAERDLVMLLALHPGTCGDVRFIAALADLDVSATQRMLERLGDAYLLDRRADGEVDLHDLVRELLVEYEADRMTVTVRRAAVARLLDHAIATVAAADALIEPDRYRVPVTSCDLLVEFSGPDEAVTWLRRRCLSLVALCKLAHGEGRTRSCWSLAQLLRGFFAREKMLELWIQTHQWALEAARAERNTRAIAMTLNNLGMAELERENGTAAAACHREAAELYTDVGDEQGATDSRSSLAWVQLYNGEVRTALSGFLAARSAYQRTGRTRNEMIALRGMALASSDLGRSEDANEYGKLAQAMARIPRDELLAVNCLGWSHGRAGHVEQASSYYAEGVALGQQHDDPAETARAMIGMGNIAALRGAMDAAEPWWSSADGQPVRLNGSLVGEMRVRRSFAD